MKKIFLAAGLLVLATAFTACNNKELESKQATIDSLEKVVVAKDTELDELFQMLNEIDTNLSKINSEYSTMQEMRNKDVEGNYNNKQKIAEQMRTIEQTLAENKQKIAQLNGRISSLNGKNKQLQDYIAKLEARAAEQETQIAELLAELENNKVVIKGLNKNVSELTAANQEKDDYIAQQIADANRAWFVVGTFKELKEAGIVSKKGGFIGIGRRQGTEANMPTEMFREIDRTKVTTIEVGLKNAYVASNHPEDSYELVPDEEDSKVTATLRILNPAKFWQFTEYLVVSTK